MATYSNQHWLLSHIRNSFISTDDTGICETVMVSDDMPKHFLRKFQTDINNSQQNKSNTSDEITNTISTGATKKTDTTQRNGEPPPFQDGDFICYPGLDQSDDEEDDLSIQSYDIQMYPEVGAHRLRSNTAQKLEKMDIARRKAARTKCVNFDDEVIAPERNDFFVRKHIAPIKHKLKKASQSDASKQSGLDTDIDEFDNGIKSRLTQQLANSPKQAQNKFMEYACFDGTSQTDMPTKRINIFINMLPERERNYPIKICVLASAKIIEVIGLVCYKATIQFPTITFKSVHHYGLYMTEDNDELYDFPPLNNNDPCLKFGFAQLTLAERRSVSTGRVDNQIQNATAKSMTSEDEKSRINAALRSIQAIDLNGSTNEENTMAQAAATSTLYSEQHFNDYAERLLTHNDMLEASMYSTYRLVNIDKRFFKTEVTMSISGERIEIDYTKIAKFWIKSKASTYAIESLALCEIIEKRSMKAILRIWFKATSPSPSSSSAANSLNQSHYEMKSGGGSSSLTSGIQPHSPTSPANYQQSSPFTFFSNTSINTHQQTSRFKHSDFECDQHTAEQILNKLNFLLEMRSSEVRREFLQVRERKLEKHQAKKSLKL